MGRTTFDGIERGMKIIKHKQVKIMSTSVSKYIGKFDLFSYICT